MKLGLTTSIAVILAIGTSVHAENFDAILDGLQENPVVPTPGSGVGAAVYDPGTFMLNVSVNFANLVGTTTDAHIHCCSTSLGTNAGVALGFTGIPGNPFPLGVTSGSWSHTFDLSLASSFSGGYLAASGGTAALARDRLLNAMRFGVLNDPLPGDSSIAYFNIHTSFRPGGEIRGNIVPEPSAMLMLLTGLPVVLRRRGRSC